MAKDLVSMKLSKTARENMTSPSKYEGPEYPWGLGLSLDDGSLTKLKIDELPDPGDEVYVIAKAKVTSVESRDGEYGKHRSVSLQITDLCVETDLDEDKGTAIITALYGG